VYTVIRLSIDSHLVPCDSEILIAFSKKKKKKGKAKKEKVRKNFE